MGATGGHEFDGNGYPLVHDGPGTDGAPGDDRTLSDRHGRNWALACHLAPLGAWAVGLPGLVGPLLVWLIKRDDVPAVAVHGREALNFQITLLAAQLGLFAFAFLTFGLGLIVVVPLLIAISIGGIVLMVIGAVRASEGRPYRYPFTWRLV